MIFAVLFSVCVDPISKKTSENKIWNVIVWKRVPLQKGNQVILKDVVALMMLQYLWSRDILELRFCLQAYFA